MSIDAASVHGWGSVVLQFFTHIADCASEGRRTVVIVFSVDGTTDDAEARMYQKKRRGRVSRRLGCAAVAMATAAVNAKAVALS